MKRCLLITLLALLFTPQETFAYFDPGSGSLFIQVIVAIVGGGILFFKDIRFKIMGLFGSKKRTEKSAPRDHEE